MMYLAENLKAFRKGKDLTQEEVAEILSVSPQSVSKWERGDSLPDITMLPALANLYKTSLDRLVGMDKLNDEQTKSNIFVAGYQHLREGEINAAIDVFAQALKFCPDDEDYIAYYAICLALEGDEAKLSQAIHLCQRVLEKGQGVKTCHTTRAALCFIYRKTGQKEKALATAQFLPHLRESREMVTQELEKSSTVADIDAYLKFIAIGESDEQNVIGIDFGVNMIVLCTEHGLLDKIKQMREEGFLHMPPIRIRDSTGLKPNQVRVRRYADYLLDGEWTDHAAAVAEMIAVLRKAYS